MESAKKNVDKDLVFDPRALRLIVGLIAFLLPFVVIIINSEMTSSISGNEHPASSELQYGCPLLCYRRPGVCLQRWHRIRDGKLDFH